MKYIKKQIALRAMQFTGENIEEIKKFVGDSFSFDEIVKFAGDNCETRFGITTFGETRGLFVGDWVIEGVKGEFYPCKNEVFVESYEEAKGNKLRNKLGAKVATSKWGGIIYGTIIAYRLGGRLGEDFDSCLILIDEERSLGKISTHHSFIGNLEKRLEEFNLHLDKSIIQSMSNQNSRYIHSHLILEELVLLNNDYSKIVEEE